jgi:hypothetical protein
MKSENGLYHIDIEIQEQIQVGNNMMKMHILDQKTMRPIEEDAEIEIAPWMAIHEHGTKVAPVIKAMGNGRYMVEMLNFTMPGPWEIHLRINKDDTEDTAVLNVSVSGEAKGGMKMSHGNAKMKDHGNDGMHMDLGNTKMMGH